eukprot:9519982-Karenia_brevis.AAC.1
MLEAAGYTVDMDNWVPPPPTAPSLAIMKHHLHHPALEVGGTHNSQEGVRDSKTVLVLVKV